MSRPLLITVSTVVHVGAILSLGHMEVERTRAATAIEVFEVADVKPPDLEPEPVEVTEPEQAPVEAPPKPRVDRAPTPKAPSRTEPDKSASASPLDALPDLGLELSGATGDTSGFAVQQGTGPRNAAPTRKTLAHATRVEPTPGCAEAAGKPKLLDLPRPTYTEAARALGVEGKVRVRITVDGKGQVVAAEVIEGLGHGLDEAAVSAARAARFEPALQCNKAVSSTFTVSIRFSAA